MIGMLLCVAASVLIVIFSLFCDAIYIKCSELPLHGFITLREWVRQYVLFNLT